MIVVAADPVEADRVVVFERWTSRAALTGFRGEGPDDDTAQRVRAYRVSEHEVRDDGPSGGPVRVVAYGEADESAVAFYTEVLGFRVAMTDPVLGLVSPSRPGAQVTLGPVIADEPTPVFGVDLGSAEAVEAALAEAQRRGLRIAYPLCTEPWGVRRFFVEDPAGNVVNVLAHLEADSSTGS